MPGELKPEDTAYRYSPPSRAQPGARPLGRGRLELALHLGQWGMLLAAGMLLALYLILEPLDVLLAMPHLLLVFLTTLGGPALAWAIFALARRAAHERAQTLAELVQRNRHLSTLAKVDQAISQTSDLPLLLNLILDELMASLVAEAGGIYLRAERGLNLSTFKGVSTETASRFVHIMPTEGAVGQAGRAGKAISLEVARLHDLGMRPYLKEEGFFYLAAAPLMMADQSHGVAVLARRQPRPFTPEEIDLLTAVGAQLGIALEHARLLRALQQRAERQASTSHIITAIVQRLRVEEIFQALAQELPAALSFDRLSVALVQEDSTIMLHSMHPNLPLVFPPGQQFGPDTAIGKVIAAGQPIIRANLEQERLSPLDDTLLKAGVRSSMIVPLIAKGRVLGSLNLASTHLGQYAQADLEYLQPVAEGLALALDHARILEQEQAARQGMEALAKELRAGQDALQEAYEAMALSLVGILEARDYYTRGHGDRVLHFVRLLARRLTLTPAEAQALHRAAQLHDLGKIGIRDSILLKPSGLTPAEWAEVRLHPEKSVEMLAGVPFLRESLPFIMYHQERWDGLGYPQGLAGEAIPLGARLLGLADSYDAMTTDRPYRKARSHEEAVAELRRGAGRQWDPALVEAFLELLAEEGK